MAEIRTQITGDSSGLNASLNNAKRSIGDASAMMSRFGRQIAGAFSASMISGFVREVVSMAGAVADASDSLGISPRVLQTFQALGREAGVSSEKIETAFARIIGAQSEAARDPSSAAAKQFEAIGIEIEALRRMSPEQLLEAIGKAADDNARNVGKMASIYELVGARSRRLVGVLRELGAQGIDAATRGAEKRGAVMDTSTVRTLDKAGDKVESLWQAMKVAAAETMVGKRQMPIPGGAVFQAIAAGTTPTSYEDENDRLSKVAAAARATRAQMAGQESLRAEMGWGEGKGAEKLRALNMGAALRQSDISDAILRIGGGASPVGAVQDKQLSVLNSIDGSLKVIAAKDTAPRLR